MSAFVPNWSEVFRKSHGAKQIKPVTCRETPGDSMCFRQFVTVAPVPSLAAQRSAVWCLPKVEFDVIENIAMFGLPEDVNYMLMIRSDGRSGKGTT